MAQMRIDPVVGQCVYEGPRFKVLSVEVVGSTGRPVRRDAVLSPESVVVLPLLDDRTVVLIRNRRFVVGMDLWELCAGTMEDLEQPLPCAERELLEETGYRAGRLEPLLDFYPAPGLSNEHMWGFLARDLHHEGQKLDENEQIEVEVVGLNRSIQMIRDGQIRDAKTIATLLYYQMFHANGKHT